MNFFCLVEFSLYLDVVVVATNGLNFGTGVPVTDLPIHPLLPAQV